MDQTERRVRILEAILRREAGISLADTLAIAERYDVWARGAEASEAPGKAETPPDDGGKDRQTQGHSGAADPPGKAETPPDDGGKDRRPRGRAPR